MRKRWESGRTENPESRDRESESGSSGAGAGKQAVPGSGSR